MIIKETKIKIDAGHCEIHLRVRAIESQCFVLAPNQVGVGAMGLMTYGNSLLIDPWGDVLIRGSESGEEVLTQEVDFGRVNAVRELTKGSELIGLDDYWKAISKKKNGFYSVIRLSDEEWVENLIYSSEKSYGSSWIYLDNKLKKVQWLFSNNETVNKNSDKGRTLPSRLRWLVLRRDAFTCQDCGGKAPNVELHIDHIIPWSEVKEHKIENLRVLCKDCNLGKGTLSLSTQKSKLF